MFMRTMFSTFLYLIVDFSTVCCTQRFMTVVTAIFVNLKVPSSTVKATAYTYGIRKHSHTLIPTHTYISTHK